MPDYKAAALTANKWRRASAVVIENPVGDGKRIVFREEDFTQLSDGRVMNEPAGQIAAVYEDPAATFPLRDPASGELTGQTATHGEVYVLLHSLYLSLAENRDAEAAKPKQAQPAEIAPEAVDVIKG